MAQPREVEMEMEMVETQGDEGVSVVGKEDWGR